MKTVMVRLSKEILFGNQVNMIETLIDDTHSSLEDIIVFSIDYIEYRLIAGNYLNENDIVKSEFDGLPAGKKLMWVLGDRIDKILAYMPTEVKQMQFQKMADRSDFYILVECNEDTVSV